MLEAELAGLRQHDRAHGVVAHRQHPGGDPQRPAKGGGHFGQGFTPAEALRSLHVGGEIPVAEPEPGLAAEVGERLQERPGLVRLAPAGDTIRDPGQRVHHRVEVRADTQSEMVEVVRGVADDGQRLSGKHA